MMIAFIERLWYNNEIWIIFFTTCRKINHNENITSFDFSSNNKKIAYIIIKKVAMSAVLVTLAKKYGYNDWWRFANYKDFSREWINSSNMEEDVREERKRDGRCMETTVASGRQTENRATVWSSWKNRLWITARERTLARTAYLLPYWGTRSSSVLLELMQSGV